MADDSMHCGWKFLIGTLALLTVAGSAYGVYIAFIAAPVCEAPGATDLPDAITNIKFVDAPACKDKTECAVQCKATFVNPLTDTPQKAVCKKDATTKKNTWDVSSIITSCVSTLCTDAPGNNFLTSSGLKNVVFVDKVACAGQAQCQIECKDAKHAWVTSDPAKTLEYASCHVGDATVWEFSKTKQCLPKLGFKLAIVSDLDKKTVTDLDRDSTNWKNSLKIGELKWDSTWSLSWPNAEHELKSNRRGMELRELVFFNDKFLTFDNKQGDVFEITKTDEVWGVTQDHSDDLETPNHPEWATVKGDTLYVGDTGDKQNNVVYVSPPPSDGIADIDWKSNFEAVCDAIATHLDASAGSYAPGTGWVKHEAIMWSSVHNRWYFLPRNVLDKPKTNSFAQQAKQAETSGSNLMISCSDDFSDCKVQTVGDTNHPDRGFSSFKFVPDSNDAKVVALKTVEKYDPVTTKTTFKTYFTMFKLSDDYEGAATILVADQLISDDKKFGGINFLP
eukprot:121530_1